MVNLEKYFIASINAANQIGAQRVLHLLDYFGSAEQIWKAQSEDLEKSGLPLKARESFLFFRKQNPNAPQKLQEFCATKNIGLCSIRDADYPPILNEIPNPPAIFYYRGQLEPLATRIAIVGTRECTSYGKEVALEFAEKLSASGITIVSGAARGIDTFAHKNAMKFGRTVAVLGCGICFRESREKQKNLAEILENGSLIMSEFAPSFPSTTGNFPMRNRIIAGLCKGVIVVEAGEKSGAILTAGLAADFGRDVFAVPGDIFAYKSIGCNKLIQDGAILITSAQDIFDFYDFKPTVNIQTKIEKNLMPALDEREKKVFNLIPFDKDITDEEILAQLDEAQLDDFKPSEIFELTTRLKAKKIIQYNGIGYRRLI